MNGGERHHAFQDMWDGKPPEGSSGDAHTAAADAATVRRMLEWLAANPPHPGARAALAALARLVSRLHEAEREVESQMQSKLDAQVTLRAVTEALDLRFDELGNGWREATPKILARIETIVDIAAEDFRERERLEARLQEAEREAHNRKVEYETCHDLHDQEREQRISVEARLLATTEALRRLASLEAFTSALDLNFSAARAIADELKARGEFARAALAAAGGGTGEPPRAEQVGDGTAVNVEDNAASGDSE